MPVAGGTQRDITGSDSVIIGNFVNTTACHPTHTHTPYPPHATPAPYQGEVEGGAVVALGRQHQVEKSQQVNVRRLGDDMEGLGPAGSRQHPQLVNGVLDARVAPEQVSSHLVFLAHGAKQRPEIRQRGQWEQGRAGGKLSHCGSLGSKHGSCGKRGRPEGGGRGGGSGAAGHAAAAHTSVYMSKLPCSMYGVGPSSFACSQQAHREECARGE
jgi:hypothetical protein